MNVLKLGVSEPTDEGLSEAIEAHQYFDSPDTGQPHVLTTRHKWLRADVGHVQLAALHEPNEGCTHIIVIHGHGFLYRDEAVALEDFDAIFGPDPVTLRNDL